MKCSVRSSIPLVLLAVLDTACSGGGGGGGPKPEPPPPIFEVEPNDNCASPQFLGNFSLEDRWDVFGAVENGVDSFDGFAVRAKEAVLVEFKLEFSDTHPSIDLDIGVFQGCTQLGLISTGRNPESGSVLLLDANVTVQIVVAAASGSSAYTLHLEGLNPPPSALQGDARQGVEMTKGTAAPEDSAAAAWAAYFSVPSNDQFVGEWRSNDGGRNAIRAEIDDGWLELRATWRGTRLEPAQGVAITTAIGEDGVVVGRWPLATGLMLSLDGLLLEEGALGLVEIRGAASDQLLDGGRLLMRPVVRPVVGSDRGLGERATFNP